MVVRKATKLKMEISWQRILPWTPWAIFLVLMFYYGISVQNLVAVMVAVVTFFMLKPRYLNNTGLGAWIDRKFFLGLGKERCWLLFLYFMWAEFMALALDFVAPGLMRSLILMLRDSGGRATWVAHVFVIIAILWLFAIRWSRTAPGSGSRRRR